MYYEDVALEVEEGLVIRGWYIKRLEKRPSDTERLLIFFHENAGNLGIRLDYFEHLHEKTDSDILAFAYRGYSESDGVPSEEGIKADTHKIMSYVKENLSEKYLAKDGIFLHGRSLGGAVAAEAFFDQHADIVDGIILENTFTSISDMVDIMFPFLVPIKEYVLKIGWDTNELVPKITAPLLFVMGKKDEIVPYK